MNYKSPSKINLFLKIAGKLPNGYHEIDTVFLPLDTPSDEIDLTFCDEGGIIITSSVPEIPCDARNLCWKAVEAYGNKTGVDISCSMHIEKRIPVAAGMGGGSSNAATVLSILNSKFQLLSDDELAELALSLGADVPFFLKPHLSRATGVGEKLVPVEFEYEPLPIVIVAPHFPVSAAWAYKHCCVADDCGVKGQMEEILDCVKDNEPDKVALLVRNDLAIPLYEKFPILSTIKEQMLDSGALCAEVSGSGPTMFGICESREAAKECAAKLAATLPESYSVWCS